MAPLTSFEALRDASAALAADKPKLVTIKGFGDVYVREVLVGEIDEQIADTEESKDRRGIARGACRLLCDAAGARILDPNDQQHVDMVAKWPLRVLREINGAFDSGN